KLIFGDGAWLLLRASGTEPLVRVYGEAFSDGDLERILRSGMSLLGV
ncbi:MAG TPA: phosphoglucomutase/phosphomannomutase family protein, partial [Aquificaceae bacterium]|nr:phosphoglucomutase/phosphomannomutase family protein [Aquificaceae bacterium]